MTQMETLKAQIQLGKVKPEKVHPEWAFQRAWNEALAWVEQQISMIEKAVDGSHTDH